MIKHGYATGPRTSEYVAWERMRRVCRNPRSNSNHPSGDPTPSSDDIVTTRKIVEAAELLGLGVLDHVIVTKDPNRSCSMFERGVMPTAKRVS
jgi:RadC-like JAB domain